MNYLLRVHQKLIQKCAQCGPNQTDITSNMLHMYKTFRAQRIYLPTLNVHLTAVSRIKRFQLFDYKLMYNCT